MPTTDVVVITDQVNAWHPLKQRLLPTYSINIYCIDTAKKIQSLEKTNLLIISKEQDKKDNQNHIFEYNICATRTLILPQLKKENLTLETISKIVNLFCAPKLLLPKGEATQVFDAPPFSSANKIWSNVTDFFKKPSSTLNNDTLSKPPDLSNFSEVNISITERSAHAKQQNDLPFHTSLNGFLLGPFQVLLNGAFVKELVGKKRRSLLAYLLCNHRRPNFRETLMEQFWPDVSPESARNSLNVSIHGIRRVLRKLSPDKEIILFHNDKYMINPEIDLKLDLEAFQQKLESAKQLEQHARLPEAISSFEEAVRLYRGDFLEDTVYEMWSYNQRERIKESYIYALNRLSDYFSESQEYKLAQHYCRKLLEKDDCREDVHRRMMWCLYQTGHRDLAVKQFHKCANALRNTLDINPSRQTIDLLSMIKQD